MAVDLSMKLDSVAPSLQRHYTWRLSESQIRGLQLLKLIYYDEGVELTIGKLPPIWVHGGILIVAALVTLPLWSGLRTTGIVAASIVIAGIILSVLAHELGHALMAQHLGHSPTLIRLHAGGGEAIWESDGCARADDRLITITGPIVNLSLGLALLAAYYLFLPDPLASFTPSSERPWSRPLPLADPPLFQALLWLGVLNLVWCGVNLLPAFPLDGGHLFYSAIEARRGSHRALFWTGLLGTFFAVVATVIFIVGILAGFVIWSPPYLDPNLQALKASRQSHPSAVK